MNSTEVRHPPTDQHSAIIGSVCLIHILENVPSGTLRPNCAQKTSNWHIYPNCWQCRSNTEVYFREYTLSNPAPEGCTDTIRLTYNPRLLQECFRVLVSLISWPGQLLSLNPCRRPKILARISCFLLGILSLTVVILEITAYDTMWGLVMKPFPKCCQESDALQLCWVGARQSERWYP